MPNILFKRHVLKLSTLIIILTYWSYTIYNSNYQNRLENQSKYKYVLLWPNKYSSGYDFLKQGDKTFVEHNCKRQNCFVTEDREYFHDIKRFDAIAFNGYEAATFDLPNERSTNQKYIFASLESPDFYPACHLYFDGYFNWTWTYKINSDFQWSYISIYDFQGNFIGPAYDIDWVKDMKPISEDLKAKLDQKTKAVAWLVSNCPSKRKREDFVARFSNELSRYGWKVDIYGRCGNLSCPFSKRDVCFKMIEDDYYFYLAFENSFAEDYVTEKLLTALNNYAVPVVYGEANYTRFLPPGSYLNSIELGPKKLAKAINDILSNKTLYYNFFRWRNHYVYRSAHDRNYCRLCEMLNNETKMNEISVVVNFRRWWNGKRLEENCPTV